MNLNAQQALALAGAIINAVEAGKVEIEAFLNFLHSNGVDEKQLAANRQVLLGDIATMQNDLDSPTV